MLNSLQAVQSNNANLNRIAFKADENAVDEAPQVDMAAPKDAFSKKGHEVRAGAITGATMAIIPLALASIPFLKKGNRQIMANAFKEAGINKFPIAGKIALAAYFAVLVAIPTAFGAGIGAIVKAFSEKD